MLGKHYVVSSDYKFREFAKSKNLFSTLFCAFSKQSIFRYISSLLDSHMLNNSFHFSWTHLIYWLWENYHKMTTACKRWIDLSLREKNDLFNCYDNSSKISEHSAAYTIENFLVYYAQGFFTNCHTQDAPNSSLLLYQKTKNLHHRGS